MSKQHPHRTAGLRRMRGFTLVELMMTICVLSILMAVAGPSFVDVIRNNRVATQTNDLVGALALARSEASKRGLPVTICAATEDQTACAGDAVDSWANGWLIFEDSTGTAGTLDEGDNDKLLQVSRRPDPTLILRTDNIGFVRYGRSGVPTNVGALPANAKVIRFELRHTTSCDDREMRVLEVERTGRANLSKAECA